MRKTIGLKSFDHADIGYTLSNSFILTLEQEQELRKNLKSEYGIDNSNIYVFRNSDGTTSLKFQNIAVKEVETNGIKQQKAVVKFEATVSKDAYGTLPAGTEENSVEFNGQVLNHFDVPAITVGERKQFLIFNINGQPYRIAEKDLAYGAGIEDIEIPISDLASWYVPEDYIFTGNYAVFEADEITGGRYSVQWFDNGKEIMEIFDTDKVNDVGYGSVRVIYKKALFDVKCSKALSDELIKLNIEPTCYRTGNSYTRAKSAEGNYPLGGELSGHIYFRDKFPGYDDGIYAGIRLIELLSHTNKNITELLEGINKYYSTPELKVQVNDDIKFKIIDSIKEYVKNKGYKYIDIDGVRVEYDDGFALTRASNTGPNITMRFEAKTKERLDEIQKEFTDKLNEFINK